MKTRIALWAMLLVCLALPLQATNIDMSATVWVVGGPRSVDPGETLCYSSDTSSATNGTATVSAACDLALANGDVGGSADPYSGFVSMSGVDTEFWLVDGEELKQFDTTLSLGGEYVFEGGTGTTIIQLEAGAGGPNINGSCQLSFDGITVGCGVSFGEPFQFQVQFDTPYYLSLTASLDGSGISGGDSLLGFINYDFNQSNGVQIDAVPEPASVLLLLTGIPVALFRQVRKWKK